MNIISLIGAIVLLIVLVPEIIRYNRDYIEDQMHKNKIKEQKKREERQNNKN